MSDSISGARPIRGPGPGAPSRENVTLLTEGPLLKGLVRLALPIVFAQFLQTVHNVVDTFWVGRLGAGAVAAVTLSFPILIVFFSLAGGVTVAGTALVAQYTGARQLRNAGKAAAQTFLTVLAVSVAMTAAGMLLSETLLRLIGAAPDVLPMADVYLKVFLLGMPFVFLSQAYASILRGVGDTVTPLRLRALGVALNIGLDPIFIFGWLGLPAMGVAGAAWASVIALAVEGVWGVAVVLRGAGGLEFQRTSFRPDRVVIKQIFRIGGPAALEMTVGTIGLSFLTAIVALFGTEAVAAYGVGSRLQSLILLPAFGIGMATTTMVGQNVGAGRPERAERATWMSTWLTLGMMTSVGMLGFLFPAALIGLFNNDPEVLRHGAGYLRIMGPAFGLFGMRVIISGAFRGAGNSVPALVLSIVAAALSVPLALWLASGLGWGPPGIWWSMVSVDLLIAVWACLWFRRGRWKESGVVQRGRAQQPDPSAV